MKKSSKVTLYVDSREKEKVKTILRQLGIRFRTKGLECGDYESPDCVFERKTTFDLIQSVRSGHLFEQLRKMQTYCEDNNKLGFLCVSGSLKETEKMLKYRGLKLNVKSLLGAIKSATVRYGMHVVWNLDDDRELLYVINGIATAVAEGKLGLPHRKILPKRYENRRIAILCDVLRVSPTIAKRLLKRYRTLRGVLLADPRKLALIDGIGPTTIRRLKMLLDSEV